MREYRPALYRAGDAIAPGGAGRELADSLYAELAASRPTTPGAARTSSTSADAAAR